MVAEQMEISAKCPIRTTLEMLGGKWRLLIIYQLSNNKLRFGDLKRKVTGVSEKMLVQELKTLIDNGLVERINYGEVPPRVEYQLTEKGKMAIPLIAEMRNFAVKYQAVG